LPVARGATSGEVSGLISRHLASRRIDATLARILASRTAATALA